LSIDVPKRLRDLMWASGRLRAGPSFKGQNLGEILIPALSAGTLQSDDPEVRLGRATEWCRDESGVEFPLGQKVLLVDGREVPLLEIRTLEMNPQTADVEASR
jgi:type VI secretion system protein ImpE